MAKLLIIYPNTDSFGRQSIPTGLITALLKKHKHQVELTVYYLPGRNQVTDKYMKFDQESCLRRCFDLRSLTTKEHQVHVKILKEDCMELAINQYDLTSALMEKEKHSNLHWNYDEHMKANGYHFIANEIKSLD